MKLRKTIFKMIAVACAFCICFTGTLYSLAWLSDKLLSDNLGFSGGSLTEETLLIAKVVNDGSNNLTEESRRYYPCSDMTINGDSAPTESEGGFTINLNQMSFGIIDNVSLPKPENVVYLRLTVPRGNGDSMNLKLYYNPDENGRFADIYKNEYDANGNVLAEKAKITESDTLADGTTPLLESFHAIESAENANDCYIKFSVAVSNVDYAASELHNLKYLGADGTEATDVKNNHYKLNNFSESSDGVTVVNDDIENAGDNYYVYVKVEPNLSVFAYSIEYITTIMPCYVYFKIGASFEIHSTSNELPNESQP
ncbi:MAG: hypothetical protein E7612_00130 [Ruminococcaceae bacterium]|nr:hypothetical protein [Oscillospiraceae bacterium]